ncbi:hypothetical protein ACEWY4_003774 [Coilia grayii]|uniref:Carboxylesterase type B domain-containing protein n=1 Tax=Coilia grayii TaxID=363190 RepID=A0ABD1KS59_9TELE
MITVLATDSGGSVFSPAAVQSGSRALKQSLSLGQELGCSPSDSAQLLACLRAAPAEAINAAQTKLLAVSGPLQAWSPVVDGLSVKEDPASALQSSRFHRVDLLLGSSTEDGLIGRARNIKRFEELQGRADSKTAFYEALSNSLGGPEASAFVKEAASWFYSLHHTPSPAGYQVFSRALENATRDLFIICPTKKMAEFWASNTKSNVFMYHLPEEMTYTSAELSMPLDVQLVFGVPHSPRTQQLFSTQERTLSKQMMTYMANFIKTGNPNAPLFLPRVSFAALLPAWPRVLPQTAGDNYKHLNGALSNGRELRRAECSFWNDYVPALKSATANLSLVAESTDTEAPTPETKLAAAFQDLVTQSNPKSEKDSYN